MRTEEASDLGRSAGWSTTPGGHGTCAAAQAYLRRQTRYRSTHDVSRGDGPLYLLATGLVVTPQQKTGRGWRCLILNDASDGSILASDIDIETALAVADPAAPVAGIDDDDTFLTVWQTRVRSWWPGPLAHEAARIIAEELPRPEPRLVELNPAAVRNLLLGLRLLRPPGLRQLLAKLTHSGLLVSLQAGDGEHWGRYRLSLPAVPTRHPAAGGVR